MEKEIIVNSLDRTEFAKEIKKLNIQEELSFYLTDAVAQNIEILFYYLILKKVKKVTFINNEKVDILCHRKFKDYLQKYYVVNSQSIIINFKNFSQDDLYDLFTQRIYLIYCGNLGIEAIWNKEKLENEKKKILKHPELLKYDKFKMLCEKLDEFAFSSFNFPIEKGLERFVFYFQVYSEQSKEKVLEFLNQLDINPNIIKEIKDNDLNQFYQYAIGFSYKNEELIRMTLYCWFNEYLVLTKQNFNLIAQKYNLELKENFNLVWFYAIDFYPKHQEIKIYDESHFFNQKLRNIEVEKVFKNKKSTYVIKYRDGKVLTQKFEFHLPMHFNDSELSILEKNGLYKTESKVLAIYLEDDEIKHFVLYD